MAQKENKINFQIGFRKGDTSALESLKKDIAEVQRLASDVSFTTGTLDVKQIQDMTVAARTLESALNQAYDVDLNTVNVKKFNQILQKSGYNAELLQEHLANAGAVGQQAFLKATGQLMQFNTVTKQTNKFLDSIAVSLFNTIKWSALSSIVNNVSGAVQKSFYYVKDLDRSLNDIRIVTNKSADDMARFADEANNAAKALGVSTENYVEGSLIYYQQGLDDETVKTLTDITAMTSNVTGQAMSAVSEQLTAVWNGYQVANQAAEEGMQVYQEYVDKMAAVGATTASDLEELSTAMSKVASAASSMGVDFDDLNAQIATIVSVTRQAPESVGTALKTIYARLGDLKVDGVDEFGTKLGEVSSQLQTMGINVLDTNGDMRQMTDVMAEVAEKWDTWTSAQKQAAAIAMAGKRQYNNLVALFDNWDMYGEALETSMNAAGTLQKQQEIAMDSLAKKMQVLQTTAEDLYDSLFNVDTITNWVEAGTGALQFLTDFTDAVGGLNNILPMLGSLGLQVFSNQIGRGLSTIVINTKNAIEQQKVMEANFKALSLMYKDTPLFEANANEGDPLHGIASQHVAELNNYYKEMYQYQSIMTEEQREQYNLIKDSKVEAGNLAIEVAKQKQEWAQSAQQVKIIDSSLLDNLDDIQKITQGTTQINSLIEEFTVFLDRNADKIATKTWNYNEIKKHFEALIEGNSELGVSVEAIQEKMKNYHISGNYDKKIKALINELKELGASTEQINKLNQKLNSVSDNAKVAGDALKNNLSITTFITDTVKAIGAVGQLAAGINTLTHVSEIWGNEELSTGEKVTQTLMNLSAVVTSLSFGFSQLGKTTFGAKVIEEASKVSSVFTLLTSKTAIQNAVQEKNNAINSISSWIQKRQVENILEKVSAEQLDLIATNKSNLGLVKYQLTKQGSVRLTKQQTKALEEYLLATVAERKATEKATIAQEAFNASLLKNPLTWVVVALAAAASAVAIYIKHIEKARKKQAELNQTTIDSNKAKQEEIKNNNDLAESYKKLYEQYEENGTGKEELYKKSLELLNVYDIEDGKILLLTEDYETLADKIEEARLEAVQANVDIAESNAKLSAQNATYAGANGINNAAYLSDNIYAFKYETKDLENSLLNKNTALGTFLEDSGYKVGTALSFDVNNYEEVYDYITLINDKIAYMDARYTQAERNASDYYKELLDQQKKFAEYLPEIEEQLDIIYSGKTELAFVEGLKEVDISNFNEVYNKVREIKEELAADIPEDILDKYVKKALSNTDLLPQEIGNKIELINAIIEKKYPTYLYPEITEEAYDEVLEQLESFNDEQLAFLALNLNTALLDQDLEEWMKEHPEVVSYTQSAPVAAGFKNFLSSYDEKEGFSDENIASLYGVEGVSSALGMTQEQFGTLDVGQQIHNATNEWINYTKETEEAREETIETLEAIKEENESVLADWVLGAGGTAEEYFNNSIKGSEELEEKSGQLKETLILLGEEGWDNLSASQQGLLNQYQDLTNITDSEIEALGKNLAYTKRLTNDINNLEGQIKSYVEQEYNYLEVIQHISDATKAHNAILDDLQSKYKTLSGIVENYNETGKWTLDNVQTLMEMSDQYVAQLTFEGDTLKLEEDSFKAVTLAKIDDLIATENLSYEQKVLELAQIAESNSTDAAAQKTSLFTQMLQSLGLVSQQTANDVRNLSSALNLIGKKGSDETKEALDQTIKAHENRLKALNSLKEDILNGGLGAAMGVGGSSGSGSGDKEKELKDFEDEFDRYWQIKKAIDAVDHSISVLEKDQKNLHGRELINSLKKENELLAEQQANYEALYELQKQEAAELRGKLSGSSLVFDATGAITNYAQATSEALATYANAVEQYNAGLIDEATLDVQEQAYNNFKKYLERYDELYYSEMQDTEDKIDDARRKQLENNLKGWETEISIKLDLQEAERNWEDFIQEINDDFKSVYKDLNVEMEHLLKKSRTYTGKNGMDGTIGTDLEAMRNVMAEIDKMEGGGFSTMFESVSQAQEKLKELGEQLQDDAKDFHKLWEDAWDTYIDGIDQSADKLEDLMDQFKRIDEELEFQGELIELLYGEEAYGLMNSLYKGQEKSLENQVQAVKAQVDMWKQLFDASGATMENQADWTADQQKYYEQWMDAQSNLNDLVIDYIKLLKTDYLNTIKDTLLTLEKSIAGVRLEDIGTEWERISDYSSKYLDNVEKAYETQKFANKIDQEIASITSLKAQQKLQAFRDKEITQLREKAVLNQYDLDAAEARYEIALKEIALEDAQANKMAMKLTRNEQGNWSYQYIADDEDVANKRQELLDAYNHLYEIASKAYEENLTSLQDLQEKYLESLEEIAELELTDKELAEQRRIELDAWYFEQYQLLAEENEIIRHDLATSGEALLLEVYRQDQEAVQGMTEFERALVQNLVDSNINSYMDLEAKVIANYNNIGDASVELMENTRRDWNSTAQEIAEAWNGDDGASVKGNVLAAYDAMIAATEDYKAKVDWCAEASVRNFGPDGITGAINGASTATDALLKSTVDMVKKTTPYLENLRQYVDKIADSWYDVQIAIGDAMSALNEYLAKEISATMLTQDRGNWKSGSPDVYHSNKGAGNKNAGSGSQKTTLATLGYSIAQDPFGSGTQFGLNDITEIGDTDVSGHELVGVQKDGVYEFIGTPSDVKKYLEELARREGVSSFGFRTGGYTGDWTGTDGRMAMLHQKELVLNENDTKNFLDGISMLRDMSSLNGSISNAILSAVAGMAMNLGTLKANGYSGSTTSTVTNGGDTFNITAEFPNANDVNDIREALLSLPNLASQYIGRVAI